MEEIVNGIAEIAATRVIEFVCSVDRTVEVMQRRRDDILEATRKRVLAASLECNGRQSITIGDV
ncbi:MAG: hypothetical protein AAGD43_28590 [Pseudomonadota bacterium]